LIGSATDGAANKANENTAHKNSVDRASVLNMDFPDLTKRIASIA
jgi:hypothetical protein